MSAPTARRLSVFAVDCAYCVRSATRIPPARRWQWHNTLHSTSRRWYADDTKTPAARTSPPKARRQTSKSKQGGATKAAEPQQQLNQPAEKSPEAAPVEQGGDAEPNTTADQAQSPVLGDAPASVNAELPYGGAVDGSGTTPGEPSAVKAADVGTEAVEASGEEPEPEPSQSTSTSSSAGQTEQDSNSQRSEAVHRPVNEGLDELPSPTGYGTNSEETPASTEPTSQAVEAPAVASVTTEEGAVTPEGAVLESEEEEALEDILGVADSDSQRDAILAAMGSEAASRLGLKDEEQATGDFWNYTPAGATDQSYLKDNVTSLGHDELEQQREYREYARLAAWELPLLSKLAKPFSPPTKQQPLRFRYTSYLGEEHPAASKVVLEFAVADLPDLTEVQRNKLIKILGVRYNPSTRTAKMSCESHDSQAQNKRELLDRLDDLLKAARDGKDTFEDVPFDFRHHKSRKWHEFPKSWIVTEERLQELMEKRAGQAQLEEQKKEIGLLVDGKKILEKVTREPPKEPERIIVNRRTGERVLPRRRV